MLRALAARTQWMVFFALSLGACNLAFRSQPSAQCTVNTNCTNAHVCFYGSCLAAEASALENTWVEMTSANNVAFPQQRTVETSARTNFAIASTQSLAGQIINNGDSATGYILLQRDSLIPSRQLYFQILDTHSTSSRFSADLEAGTYHPIFFPDNPALAPLPLDDWIVKSDAQTLTVIYPTTPLVTITGRIGPSAANPTQGISARVYAVEPGTQLTSTAVPTDATGHFSILMSPTVASPNELPVTLVIGPGDTNVFVPLVQLAIAVNATTTALGDIYLTGVANTASVTGSVSGVDAAGTSTTLAGTSILASATIGGGTFSTGALADASGTFTLALITSTDPQPLAYAVDIIPPPDSAFGRTEVRYDLPPTGTPEPISIKLGARLVLSGTVVDADGSPVANAQVVATPQDATVIGASALQTLSGSDGRFALRVDPNKYLLSVTPAPGSRQPVGQTKAQVTTSNVDTTIKLPRGVLVCGEVTAPNGTTTNGTRMDFYHDAGSGPQRVGLSTVDVNGHYSVVLPAQ